MRLASLCDVYAHICAHCVSSTFQFDCEDKSECKYSYINQILATSPTVEAIPIEQVAELLNMFSLPCSHVDCEQSDFCVEHCKFDQSMDTKECWVHALREGWLDGEQ